MRVDSTSLPIAAREHRQRGNAHATDKAFPSVPSDQANDIATTKRSGAANLAATANAADTPARPDTPAGSANNSVKSEKLSPAGLIAAQVRFQTMNPEDMTKGQSRALEVITRNLARYTANLPTEAPLPTTAGIPVENTDKVST